MERRRPTWRESSLAAQPGRTVRSSGRSSKFAGEPICRTPSQKRGTGSYSQFTVAATTKRIWSKTSRLMKISGELGSKSARQLKAVDVVVLVLTVALSVKEASSSVVVSLTRPRLCSGSEGVSPRAGRRKRRQPAYRGLGPLARPRNGSKPPNESRGNYLLKPEGASAVRD